MKELIEKGKEIYQKHEKLAPIYFFILGFCFDILTLGNIDDFIELFQQSTYLVISATILVLSLLEYKPKSEKGIKIWSYHEEALSFFMGGLLSVYTLLYFKASSIFTSFIFLIILCILLLANESKRARSFSKLIPLSLFSLCLTSFYVCLIPTLFGTEGPLPFLTSILASYLTFAIIYKILKSKKRQGRTFWAFSLVQAVFIALYFTGLIPPVPLMVNTMGIYHEVKKEDGKFALSMTRPNWKFWQKGDQEFFARPGDKIYFYTRIYSPGNFSSKINIRWLHFENKSWLTWDAIPLPISGGREEGFRAHTYKSNYSPGEWRVQVETSDGREVGRLYFTVIADTSEEPREMNTILE